MIEDGCVEQWYEDAKTYGSEMELHQKKMKAPVGVVLTQVEVLNNDVPNISPDTGKKFDQGKPRFSLVPNQAMSEVVDVLTFGASKYGDHNWKQIPGLQNRYYDALQRHLSAFRDGHTLDDESGKHHLAHAACCVLFMLQNDLEGSL